MDFKNQEKQGFKIHEDLRAWSLENVCILYGHIDGVIVGLGYTSY